MIKFKLYFDNEKEAEWLNEMSAKGYALSDYWWGFYSFEKCLPGEYVYQIDIVDGFFNVDDDYRMFMEDLGVELVCMWGFWVILRKKTAEGPFQLYTDVESSIEHYSKIKLMFKAAAILEIICTMIMLLRAIGGSLASLSLSFVMMALVAVMIRQVMHVNKILAELKERIGEPVRFAIGKRRKLSGFIVWGFLFNSIGILLKGWELPYVECIRGIVHGLALLFFLIGLLHTFRKSDQERRTIC